MPLTNACTLRGLSPVLGKDYKRLVKRLKRNFQNGMLEKIPLMEENNPKPISKDYNHRQNKLGRLYKLTVVHFNPEKNPEFSLLLNIPRPPIQCWDITEQLRAQTLMF